MAFKLAIVGSTSLMGNEDARRLIRSLLDEYQAAHPDLVIVSGGALGIDQMAAQEARARRLEVIEHFPQGQGWRFYRTRNLEIANDCDHLIRIARANSRAGDSGWTRDRAREFGKPTTEHVIDWATPQVPGGYLS